MTATMKKLINVLAILLIATLIFLCYGRSDNNVNVGRDTVTLVRRDTLRDTIRLTRTDIKEISREVVRLDTILKDTVLAYEHKHFQDTFEIGQNKAIVDIFTTGVDTRLDSMKIDARIENYETTTITTITNTVERKKKFKDRLFLAPSVGAGYGLTTNKADIYVGVSAGIKLW
jgi:hypothetical protein